MVMQILRRCAEGELQDLKKQKNDQIGKKNRLFPSMLQCINL